MPLLTQAEYDQTYFEGHLGLGHTAGYTKYHREEWRRVAIGFLGLTEEESTGTYFGDLAKGLHIRNDFSNASVLEIGCGYGFLVKGLRSAGIEAYGIDLPYPISQAPTYCPEAVPYLTASDALTYLQNAGRNQFDYIVSRWFLETQSDADIALLVPELNRVCKADQLHIINPNMRVDYYNVKTQQEWVDGFAWERGTIFVVNNDFDNWIKKN